MSAENLWTQDGKDSREWFIDTGRFLEVSFTITRKVTNDTRRAILLVRGGRPDKPLYLADELVCQKYFEDVFDEAIHAADLKLDEDSYEAERRPPGREI